MSAYHAREHAVLYVIEARRGQSAPYRDLSILERLEGWVDYRDALTGERRAINKGHEYGLIHSLTAPHLLTWQVSPGDRVIATLEVTFRGTARAHTAESGEEYLTREWYEGQCEAAVHLPRYGEVAVRAKTHPGRDALLGEDTLDAAFEGDAIELAIRERLEGGSQMVPCEVTFETLGDEDAPLITWQRITEAAP